MAMCSAAIPSEHAPAQTVAAGTERETPYDAVLPQLGLALDTALMQRLLGAALLDTAQLRASYELHGCVIDQIRYKPGKSCTISYRLVLRDTPAQREQVQLCYAKIWPAGGSCTRWHKAQQQRLSAPAIGRPLLHIPALEMVVWMFPNDRKLAGLPVLVGHERLRSTLPPILAANWGGACRLGEISSELVHYVAEHTCTIRAELGLVDTRSARLRSATVYGKVYSDEQGATAYRRMRQLWHSPERRAGQLLMAQPLGYQPEHQLLWQRGLDGSTLEAHIARGSEYGALLAQAAAAVAALHRWPLAAAQAIPGLDMLEKLRRAARLVALVRPASAELLAGTVQRLAQQARSLGRRAPVALHGDLHLRNFMVMADAVALIDLDTLSLGDPLHDLGSFVAGLYARGLLEPAAQSDTERQAELFVQAYAQHVSWTVAPADLDWYIAAALISERAARGVTRLKAGRLATVDRIIELADRLSSRHAAPVAR